MTEKIRPQTAKSNADDAKHESKLLPKWFWLGRVVMDSAQLNGCATEVAFWLADYADKDSRAYPSRETLANLIGCSVRAVDTATASLGKRGWISQVGSKPGPGQTRRWAINWQHAQISSGAGALSASAQQRAKLFASHALISDGARAETGDQHAQISSDNPSYPFPLKNPPSIPEATSSENRSMAISSSAPRDPEAFERKRAAESAALKGQIWQGLPPEHQRRFVPDEVWQRAVIRGRSGGIKLIVDHLEGREAA